MNDGWRNKRHKLLLLIRTHRHLAVILLREDRLKNDGWSRKRHKLLLFVRTHRLCSNTARRKQTKNDGSSRKRHKLLLLVRTHRHYAVILLEMVDGAERKRHWHWQLLLVRSERLDGWQTRRETTTNALGGKKETLTIIVGEIRETGRDGRPRLVEVWILHWHIYIVAIDSCDRCRGVCVWVTEGVIEVQAVVIGGGHCCQVVSGWLLR